MPLYEYIAEVDGKEVGRINLPLPVASRDAVRFRRAPLPRSLTVSGHAENPEVQANQVLRGYKRAEQRAGNTREFRRRIGHSPETVKRAWATP